VKYVNRKSPLTYNSILRKLCSKSEGDTKTSPYEQTLREFTTSSISLQEILTEVVQGKGNDVSQKLTSTHRKEKCWIRN
jgi:hypothetical protein